jgi:hypothetical protein
MAVCELIMQTKIEKKDRASDNKSHVFQPEFIFLLHPLTLNGENF